MLTTWAILFVGFVILGRPHEWEEERYILRDAFVSGVAATVTLWILYVAELGFALIGEIR